jgi:hypothetical protein
VGIVVGIGALVGSRGNLLLSIVATALIALAFHPVRERARHLANRMVYGKRASPYEVLAGFSARIAGSLSVDEVLPALVAGDSLRDSMGVVVSLTARALNADNQVIPGAPIRFTVSRNSSTRKSPKASIDIPFGRRNG